MKGPHAAALAAGWLAVALSMAALATAAISRVGTQSSGAQAQVTITMTATVRTTSSPVAPSSVAQLPSATTTDPTIEIPPAAQTASRVVTTHAGRSSTVSRTTFAAVAIATAPAASTSSPVFRVPNSTSQTPTPSASTKKPTATKTTKTPTPSATTKNTVDANGTISDGRWTQRQGGIHAGCRGNSLAIAEPWAATGYQVAKSSNWIRTAIVFSGSDEVTVLVGCQAGHATFSTSS